MIARVLSFIAESRWRAPCNSSLSPPGALGAGGGRVPVASPPRAAAPASRIARGLRTALRTPCTSRSARGMPSAACGPAGSSRPSSVRSPRPPEPRHPRGAGGQPRPRPPRARLGRQVSRSGAHHAARGAPLPGLRIEEPLQALRGRTRARPATAFIISFGISPPRMHASKPRNCSMLKRRSSASSAQRQTRSSLRAVHALMKLRTTSGG